MSGVETDRSGGAVLRPAPAAAARGRSRAGACCATGRRWLSLVVFVLVVLACLAAPLYADDIAHTDPFESNVNGHDDRSTASACR